MYVTESYRCDGIKRPHWDGRLRNASVTKWQIGYNTHLLIIPLCPISEHWISLRGIQMNEFQCILYIFHLTSYIEVHISLFKPERKTWPLLHEFVSNSRTLELKLAGRFYEKVYNKKSIIEKDHHEIRFWWLSS